MNPIANLDPIPESNLFSISRLEYQVDMLGIVCFEHTKTTINVAFVVVGLIVRMKPSSFLRRSLHPRDKLELIAKLLHLPHILEMSLVSCHCVEVLLRPWSTTRCPPPQLKIWSLSLVRCRSLENSINFLENCSQLHVLLRFLKELLSNFLCFFFRFK